MFRTFTGGAGLIVLALLCMLLSASLPVQGAPTISASDTFASGITSCTPPIEPVQLSNPTVVTTCTQAALQNALNNGGQITFDCGPDPVTIPISSPLQTSATVDTVIDGGGLITLDGQGTTRILEKPFTPGSDTDKTSGNDLTIQHMRFINGKAPAATKNRDGNARGGALTVNSPGTRLHIINSTFEDNSTTSINDEDNQGGAIFSANIYETVIVGSVFENNIAGSGGAFGGIATGLIVYNSRFSSNHGADTSTDGIVAGHGGALHLDGVTNNFNPQSNRIVDVCGSVFDSNTATRGGGAIKVTVSDNKGTKASYRNSTFRNNEVKENPSIEDHGGAIYHIEDVFAGGTSEDNIEIVGSTFEGNYSPRQGGAAWILVHGKGRVVNSTFYANAAATAGTGVIGQGGGLIISKGVIDIVNTTFANNFATFQGGAIFAGGSGDPERKVTLTNSLFYENRLEPIEDSTEWQGYHTNRPLQNGGGNLQYPRKKLPEFTNEVNNLITSPASAIIFDTPDLGALAANGGPTRTMALLDGSPAIDAGTASGCPSIDQRGVSRPGSGTAAAVCDIGAYEVSDEQPPDTAPDPDPGPDPQPPLPPGSPRLYMPLLLSSQAVVAGQPDLVGTVSIQPEQDTFAVGDAVEISVVISNIGTAPTSEGFWADLFINPATPPAATALPLRWAQTCSAPDYCFGLAWGIDEPLEPGQSITLTSTAGSYAEEFTRWPGWLASGPTDLYLYVDNWGAASTGNIEELREDNNRAELRALTVTGDNPPLLSSGASRLPDRPRPLQP